MGMKKGSGFKAPHATVLYVLRSDTVSGSWSLEKSEKAGIDFVFRYKSEDLQGMVLAGVYSC